MKIKGWIYGITNIATGRWYVGRTQITKRYKDVSDRWNDHINALKRNKHYNSELQGEWNQYGMESFIFSVLYTIEDEELIVTRTLDKKEIEYTYNYKADYHTNGGFVLKVGGKGGRISELTRKRMSESSANKKIIFQYTKKGEFIAEYKSANEAAKALKLTHGTITKAATSLSRTAKGYLFVYKDDLIYYKNNNIKIKYIPPKNSRVNSVVQLTLDGKFISRFRSCREAEQMLNVSNVNAACKNIENTVSGYRFMYEIEYIENGFKFDLKEFEKKKIDRLKSVVLTNINFKFIKEFNSVKECSEYLGISENGVRSRCTKFKVKAQKYRLIFKDIYMQLSKEDIDKILYDTKLNNKRESLNSKPIVQLDLNGLFLKKFESATYIQKNTSFDNASIRRVCNTLENRKCIPLNHGQVIAYGYIWLRLDYYLNLNEEDICDILRYINNRKCINRKSKQKKGVVCLSKKGEFLNEFDSVTELAKCYDINTSLVVNSCKKKRIVFGKYFFVYSVDFYSENFSFQNLLEEANRGLFIVAIDINTNDVLTFNSIKLASDSLNIDSSYISHACKKNISSIVKAAKGYIFVYKENYLTLKSLYSEDEIIYMINHAANCNKRKNKNKKAIVSINLDNNAITIFKSLSEAEEKGYSMSPIRDVAFTLEELAKDKKFEDVRQLTAYNCIWLYKSFYDSLEVIELNKLISYVKTRKNIIGIVVLDIITNDNNSYLNVSEAAQQYNLTIKDVNLFCKTGAIFNHRYVFVYENEFYSKDFDLKLTLNKNKRKHVVYAINIGANQIKYYSNVNKCSVEFNIKTWKVYEFCKINETGFNKMFNGWYIMYEKDYLIHQIINLSLN